jgi:hypothetical protein
MVKRIRLSEVKVEPESYEAAVQEITQVEEPKIEETKVEEPPKVEEAIEPIEPVRMKKGHPTGTCEGCGKTMTLKNLKYAHNLVCPAKAKQFVNDVSFESEEVMPVPVPPKLERQVAHVEEESAEKPKPKPKAKRQPRVHAEEKHVSHEVSAELVRVSRGSKKIEVYSRLAAKALP